VASLPPEKKHMNMQSPVTFSTFSAAAGRVPLAGASRQVLAFAKGNPTALAAAIVCAAIYAGRRYDVVGRARAWIHHATRPEAVQPIRFRPTATVENPLDMPAFIRRSDASQGV